VRCGEAAKGFRADTETFLALVVQAQKKVEEQENEKTARESAIVQKQWPDIVETDSGVKFLIVQQGKGDFPMPGSKVRVRYTGEVLGEKKFFSTREGIPDDEPPAEEFVMQVGQNQVTPGFDRAVIQMRVGEKRILVLPSHLAYGTGGFYAREIKGKKRFVISPNSTLVYDVELLEIIF
jgi:FKBP-type peptidyl-prolyl cis-trans isomerase